MYGQRASDSDARTHYRSERVSSVNGQFYFSTREGTLEGPYFTRFDAEREVHQYINRQIQAKELLNRRSH
ncbi:DUF6316 family protein [Pseudomonas sp. LS44]|uniref:DUF6316 family protein n=1 Tax=Pseudomonas sp. LS44 TaxID=1357074 RepID=UPI00215B6B83|nr:DUF6316 family protein [Pseudomonas sp. LS44]UVE19103.1 DUF6316 family protein [Pseudomonas sp. LS44]